VKRQSGRKREVKEGDEGREREREKGMERDRDRVRDGMGE
jgi:hypothetical protein